MGIQNLTAKTVLQSAKASEVAGKLSAGVQATTAARRAFAAEAATGSKVEAAKTAVSVARMAYQSARTVAGARGQNGQVEAQLARIAALDKGQPRKTVTILGAGVSGLTAAYELERLGHSVRILEGNDRIGGRVLTHRFSDGTSHELGGMRIPASHDYTRHYVDELGLKLRRFVSSNENQDAFYDIAGVKTPIGQAREALYAKFGVDAEKAADIEGLMGRHLNDVIESLSAKEKQSLWSTKLSSKRLRALDETTLEDFLRSRGATEGELQLFGETTGLSQRFKSSVTSYLRGELGGLNEGLEEIVGGMDMLPRGIAGKLETPVELNTKVLGIRHLDDGKIELTLSKDGGEPYVETHENVLSTLPFSVTKRLETPNLSPQTQAAIDNTPYDTGTKVLLHSRRRFWEEQGLFGGASHSDRGIGATYYPSNNALDRDAAVSEGPGVLLGSYTQGDEARRLAAMSPEVREQTVVDELARIHPEVADKNIVDETASIAWDEKNPWSRGSVRASPAGGHHLYGDAIRSDGNLFFAGEHASHVPGWVQGSLISTLRAVEEIVTKPASKAERAAADVAAHAPVR